jgi:hypothetical protein
MAIVGTYEMLKMNTWHIKPRPVCLLVGAPIATAGMNAREAETLAAQAREVIAGLYHANTPAPDRPDPHLRS